MSMTDSILTTRNATLTDLAALLERQQHAKLDIVTASESETFRGRGDAARLVDHSVHQRVDSPMRI